MPRRVFYFLGGEVHAVGLPERCGQHVKWGNPANPGYNHKSIPLMAMHSCIAGHVAQMRNLVTAINHDQPVRRH